MSDFKFFWGCIFATTLLFAAGAMMLNLARCVTAAVCDRNARRVSEARRVIEEGQAAPSSQREETNYSKICDDALAELKK